MAYGPAPQEHQVVYTTLAFDEPWTLDNYLKVDGWKAWKKILADKPDPATIVDEVKKSALRGRGQAQFSAITYWRSSRAQFDFDGEPTPQTRFERGIRPKGPLSCHEDEPPIA